MKLSDLKVGNKLGISVYGCKKLNGDVILLNPDGHINDIINEITDEFIGFNYYEYDFKVSIKELYEKGLLEKEFILPDIWYTKLTNENVAVIKKWIGNTHFLFNIGAYYGLNNGNFDAWSSDYLPANSNLITFEEFKDYVLNKKQQKVMFTKQDWIERKCVIKFDALKREVTNKFLKECNPENSAYNSIAKYIISSKNKVGFWGCSNEILDNLPVVTIDELLNPNNMVENKKIVGYKTIGNLVLTKEETERAASGLALTLDKANHPEAFEPIYEENLELGGYKLEFTKTTMKFDGATFKKAELEILEEVLEDNSQITIRLHSIPVTLELLKKIIKNFK